MATWKDVDRIALSFEGAQRGMQHRFDAWKIRDRAFAWKRPLSKKDRSETDRQTPDDSILAVRVPDTETKDAMLAHDPDAFFTIPHFNGFNAVLVDLDQVSLEELKDALNEGYLAISGAAAKRKRKSAK